METTILDDLKYYAEQLGIRAEEEKVCALEDEEHFVVAGYAGDNQDQNRFYCLTSPQHAMRNRIANPGKKVYDPICILPAGLYPFLFHFRHVAQSNADHCVYKNGRGEIIHLGVMKADEYFSLLQGMVMNTIEMAERFIAEAKQRI